MHAVVHAADIQDRDGGALVMATMFGLYPFLLKLYADGGYQGPVFRDAVTKILARVNVKSSSARIKLKALSSCQNAGSSKEPSHGSGVADGSQRIGKISIEGRSRSCVSRP